MSATLDISGSSDQLSAVTILSSPMLVFRARRSAAAISFTANLSCLGSERHAQRLDHLCRGGLASKTLSRKWSDRLELWARPQTAINVFRTHIALRPLNCEALPQVMCQHAWLEMARLGHVRWRQNPLVDMDSCGGGEYRGSR